MVHLVVGGARRADRRGLLLLRIAILGLQIGEHLDDVLGHRRRGGKVIAAGLESVLVGDPVDGDGSAVGIGVRIRAARHSADILRFGADFFLASAHIHLDPIVALESAESSSSDTN